MIKTFKLKIIGLTWLVMCIVILFFLIPVEARRVRGVGKIGLGGRDAYLAHLYGELPEAVKHLRFSLTWPIDMNNPEVYLAVYFGEREDPGNWIHSGVDIQVKPGTPVKASQGGKVIFTAKVRGMENLTEVYIYSSDGLLYAYAHMDSERLSEKIKSRLDASLDFNTDVTVEAGEVIGEVGEWPFLLDKSHPYPNRKIPPAVEQVYGKEFHHLHFEIRYVPIKDIPSFLLISSGWEVNPLLLLNHL